MINSFFNGLERNTVGNAVRHPYSEYKFDGHTFRMNDQSKICTEHGDRKSLAYGAIMDGREKVLVYCSGNKHDRQIVGYISLDKVNGQMFDLLQNLGEKTL